MLRFKLGASLALLLALVAVSSNASIENEPVKVTHRNSGPRYDIDEVERTRLNQAAAASEAGANEVAGQPPPGSGADRAQTDEQPAIGHISIRRIFLVPMMPHNHGQEDAAGSGPDSLLWGPPRSSQSSQAGNVDDDQQQQQMGPFRRPSFWPFMPPQSPLAPSRHQHLFGADKASRSPAAEASEEKPQSSSGFGFGASEGERERETSSPRPPGQAGPAMDPIQMLVDLMHQALNPGMQAPSGNNFFTDLNKEASASRGSQEQENSNRQATEASGLATRKPASQNETREDIVEIEGKKFLRKAIINRHQGDNIIFMTKRLIFIPLNETESAGETTATVGANSTPAAPTSTVGPADQDSRRARPAGEEEATTTTTSTPTTTTTTTTEAPIQASSEPTTSESPIIGGTQEGADRGASASAGAPVTTAPSAITTESSVEETTTPKESLMRKLSESFEKAAERLLESAASSTTEQPPARAPQNGV